MAKISQWSNQIKLLSEEKTSVALIMISSLLVRAELEYNSDNSIKSSKPTPVGFLSLLGLVHATWLLQSSYFFVRLVWVKPDCWFINSKLTPSRNGHFKMLSYSPFVKHTYNDMQFLLLGISSRYILYPFLCEKNTSLQISWSVLLEACFNVSFQFLMRHTYSPQFWLAWMSANCNWQLFKAVSNLAVKSVLKPSVD